MPSVLANVFSNIGLQAFGVAMPRIAWTLWDQGPPVNVTRDDPNQPPLTLTGQINNGPQPQPAMWLAPLPGVAREYQPGDGPDLRQVGGVMETAPGLLLTVHPQAYSRLSRLYTELLEVAPNPRGVPTRPVPRYFFYTNFSFPAANASPNVTLGGGCNTGDPLGWFDHMRCYDNEGHAIDPLAALSAFTRIAHYYPPLLWLPGVAFGAPVQNGLDAVLGAGGPGQPMNDVRIYLTRPDGTPFDATGVIGGLAPINAAAGLFVQTGPIARTAATPGLRFGSSQAGTLAAAFAPPALATPAIPQVTPNFTQPAALQRDFFHLRVVDHDSFLLGAPEPNFANPRSTVTLEQRPVVRLDHPLTPLIGGNAVVAAAAAVVASGAGQTQVVAETIDPAFVPPTANVATSLWPAFVVPPAGPAVLPANLQNLAPTALWVGVNGQPGKDVQLTITGLPPGAHVRVYPRELDADYAEHRGDGAGMIVPGSGTAVLVLRDPLRLPNPNHPDVATLRFDVALATDQPAAGAAASRTYGNLTATLRISDPLAPTPPPPPPVPPSPFLAANIEAGVSHSRISGLDLANAVTIGDFFDELLSLENTATPQNPREATRLPTMAMRELIVSDRTTAVLSGGRLAPDAWSSQTRIGAPGSTGGREVQSVGVGVSGLLAHDLARIALRRTRYLPLQLIELAGLTWDDAGAAPPVGPPNTFAAAVLQNIAPVVDMPNLHYLAGADIQDHDPTAYTNPDQNYNIFVNWVATRLGGKQLELPFGQTYKVADGLAQLLVSGEQSLESSGINGYTPADKTTTRVRLYRELERRLVTTLYGRHDSERALRAAFAGARRLIYIETPGIGLTNFGFDAANNVQITGDDLWVTLANRMQQCPGLRVVLCTPQETDYPRSFADHIAYEKLERTLALAKLDPNRVRVFSPIGFAGRPSRLATTTIVVDDAWALVGSSSLRRRGLRFDGSTDLVFTDGVYERGVCPAIGAMRRQLLAARLGVPAQDTGLPHPGFVRLLDPEQCFEVVRELLDDGGYGSVEPFIPGDLPAFPEPAKARTFNPDGADVAPDLQLWVELWNREFITA